MLHFVTFGANQDDHEITLYGKSLLSGNWKPIEKDNFSIKLKTIPLYDTISVEFVLGVVCGLSGLLCWYGVWWFSNSHCLSIKLKWMNVVFPRKRFECLFLICLKFYCVITQESSSYWCYWSFGCCCSCRCHCFTFTTPQTFLRLPGTIWG